MSKILDGNLISKKIYLKIQKDIFMFAKRKMFLKLAIILVGNDPASEIYVKIKEIKAKELGIGTYLKRFPESSTNYEIKKEIEKLNQDNSISGIILQLPLPKHLDMNYLIPSIDPKKDIDVLHPQNLGNVLLQKTEIFPPAASAIFELIKHYKISLENKNIVLVGYGRLVGKPLSVMLPNYTSSATFSICTHKTKNLKKFTKEADILITAVGKNNLITKDMVKKNAIIFDAGTTRIDRKITGDTDYKNIVNKCKLITPPIGGIGPITVAKLFENAVKLANKK